MSLMRRDRGWDLDPFREIARLEDQMRNIFSNVFGDRELSLKDRVFAPLIDIRETENNYIIEADIPGFKKEEITIEATPEAIEISAERKEEKTDKKKGEIIHQERCAYKFFRTFSLPGPIDTEKINPSFSNGTLKLELTKLPGIEKKRITL